MEWYHGSVTDAISEARMSDKLLSILVYGEDPQSEQLASSLTSELLAPLTSQLISLKLKQPSQELTQFAAIYPVLFVPSVYVICARTGVALEVVAGVHTAEDLADKIKKVLDSRSSGAAGLHQQQNLPAAENLQTGTLNAGTSNAAPVAETSSGDRNVADNEAQLKEKVERAEKLIELVRQDKAKKEMEDERRKEIERREAMKNVQRIKREMEEKEIQELAQQKQKERDEERRYRAELQEKIRQERLERHQKHDAEKAQAEERRRKLMQEKQEEAERIKIQKSKNANILYRLPDGTTVTHLFDAEAPFIEVRQYIADVKQLSDFGLALNFPRRIFEADCNQQTLRSLQLAPSSVLLVISKSQATSSGGNRTFSSGRSWWDIIVGPFSFAFSFISSFVGAILPQSSIAAPQDARQSQSRDEPETSRTRNQDVRKRTPYQRSGNIHRLNTSDESDNENNTWNGNSTQQM